MNSLWHDVDTLTALGKLARICTEVLLCSLPTQYTITHLYDNRSGHSTLPMSTDLQWMALDTTKKRRTLGLSLPSYSPPTATGTTYFHCCLSFLELNSNHADCSNDEWWIHCSQSTSHRALSASWIIWGSGPNSFQKADPLQLFLLLMFIPRFCLCYTLSPTRSVIFLLSPSGINTLSTFFSSIKIPFISLRWL